MFIVVKLFDKSVEIDEILQKRMSDCGTPGTFSTTFLTRLAPKRAKTML